MDIPRFTPSLLYAVLRALLAWLPLDRLALLLEFVGRLRASLAGRGSDLYENLHYTATLELCDATGARAFFRKEQRVCFLQNHIIAFEDYAWGDGTVLAQYRCAPGVVVDRYRDGDRWTLLISLREAKQRGDEVTFRMERVERNSFRQTEEWLQVEIRRPTRHMQMRVVFPAQRPCRRAAVVQRSRLRTLPLGPEHMHLLPDGRQAVWWEARHVRPYELFTLRWTW